MAANEGHRLKKELSLLDVYVIALGPMLSSGFFLLPGLAAAKTGPSVVLAYFLAGLLVLPAMLSKAELATAMPRAGGTYYFLDRSLGTVGGHRRRPGHVGRVDPQELLRVDRHGRLPGS